MPLTKAQKLLYEAALLRKGLQPGKAVREEFPDEYNAMPYLEDLFPEEY